ncbi:MAG TPA: ABC transporter permease [Burkholderiales bacterium]|nr:ABC transporter permease [Burkholderiales bacterium]
MILRRGLRNDPAFWFGVAVLIAAIAIAIAGPWLTPYDPNANNLTHRLQSPSAAHWFGTDDLGRDIFSRMLAGARISISFPFGSVALAIVLGLPAGLLAGYGGTRLGRGLDFAADILMSFPPLLLAIAFIAVRGPGLGSAMIVVGIIFAPRLFRIARAATQEVMAETYIEAARAIGSSPFQILLWHVLRNIAGPVIVYVSFAMGTALLIEAILSFIGLGVQPPAAGWGSMLGRAFRYLYQSPSGIVFPGAAIAATVLAFNLLGDALRDAVGRPISPEGAR